jgi:mannose-6-phosphate isomerase
VLGSNCQIFSEFPILIKFIDSRDNLSIQVHPNNVYAMETAKQYGKTEMWYILDAKPGAFLYLGFQHEISREEFKRRIEENTLTEVLNAVPVQKGQCFYIPAGTIHAIGKNIVIAEIQQSSNLTYRVYDYGRVGADGKPRELHIEQALDVTKLTPPRMEYNFGGHLVRCPYFTTDVLEAPFSAVSTDESFTSLLVLEGEGELVNGNERVTVRKGDSVFLSAESGVYMVSGTVRLLRTEVGTI